MLPSSSLMKREKKSSQIM